MFGREEKQKENIEEKSGKNLRKWLFGRREKEEEEKRGGKIF